MRPSVHSFLRWRIAGFFLLSVRTGARYEFTDGPLPLHRDEKRSKRRLLLTGLGRVLTDMGPRPRPASWLDSLATALDDAVAVPWTLPLIVLLRALGLVHAVVIRPLTAWSLSLRLLRRMSTGSARICGALDRGARAGY